MSDLYNPTVDTPTDDRRTYLGSSDGPIVTGLSKWMNRVELWKAKRADEPWLMVDDDEDDYLVMGRIFEQPLIDLAAERLGAKVIERNVRRRHPGMPWLAAEADAIIEFDDGGRALMEAKTTGFSDDWGDPGTDEIPTYYTPQPYIAMAVFNIETCYVVCAKFGKGRKIDTYKVVFDKTRWGLLSDDLEDFWKLVVTGVPPEPTTGEEVFALHPFSVPDAIEATDGIMMTLKTLAARKADHKVDGQFIKDLEDAVKVFIGKHEGAKDPATSKMVATYKTSEGKRLDTKTLKVDAPEVYAKYAMDTVKRMFLNKVKP